MSNLIESYLNNESIKVVRLYRLMRFKGYEIIENNNVFFINKKNNTDQYQYTNLLGFIISIKEIDLTGPVFPIMGYIRTICQFINTKLSLNIDDGMVIETTDKQLLESMLVIIMDYQPYSVWKDFNS